jgi:putative hemolysin
MNINQARSHLPRPADLLAARPLLAKALRLPLEWIVSWRTLDSVYQRTHGMPDSGSFADRVLAALDVVCGVSDSQLERIPRDGPLVVVANHPFGGIDGLILLALIGRVRSDVRLIANSMLTSIPELAPSLIAVDPYGGAAARTRNIAPLRAAVRWLRMGGSVGVFPAGDVAAWDCRRWSVREREWEPSIAGLIRAGRAAVLPVHFEGTNRLRFHLAGLVHPRVWTLLLPREMLAMRGQTLRVSVGKVVPPAKVGSVAEDAGLARRLRIRTLALGGKAATRKDPPYPRLAPIIDALPHSALASEIASLPTAQRLVESGEHEVWITRATQTPQVLREIGRLREIAFRAAGEGTGRALDVDGYDAHYLHLLVWNRQRREIIGAYRLALVDEIVERFGMDGLYTHSLFRYRRRLLDELGPALELGRSFVRVECQKDYAPLALLWRGIGRFVADRPQYRRLFGPVSISNDYGSLSKNLLIAFLRLNNSLPRLARLVTPRNAWRDRAMPRPVGGSTPVVANSVDEVDDLVREAEGGVRGIPVLLRQYLKLNAKLLGFNVDPSFGNALDALMVVDLTQIDRAVLVRYLGRERAANFLTYHGQSLEVVRKRALVTKQVG